MDKRIIISIYMLLLFSCDDITCRFNKVPEAPYPDPDRVEEFKTNIGNNCRLLGIDPGSKHVGIAICDENQVVATPLKIIHKKKFESLLMEIDILIKENNIKGIIVGNPINMDGSKSK